MKKDDILIKVNQLYKIFGDKSIEALDLVKSGMGKDELLEKSDCVLGLNNINLNINKAKIQVVMGLSGSGKSTLIRHLNRLIEPTSGQVLVNDTDILISLDSFGSTQCISHDGNMIHLPAIGS